jgi:hypothetical protein
VLVMVGMMIPNASVKPAGTRGRVHRPNMTFERLGGDSDTCRWRCHPTRCRASWSADSETIVTAFVLAVRAGRRDLTFGDNL